jgi:hypothetical protein
MRSLPIAAAFVCSGVGLGAVIAKLAGVTSWLDAKLYLVAGFAVGALVAAAIEKAHTKPDARGNGHQGRQDPLAEKACSICGQVFPLNEFSYGNRENRSYCKTCDKDVKAAYSAGGVEGARRFRDKTRATWKH